MIIMLRLIRPKLAIFSGWCNWYSCFGFDLCSLLWGVCVEFWEGMISGSALLFDFFSDSLLFT